MSGSEDYFTRLEDWRMTSGLPQVPMRGQCIRWFLLTWAVLQAGAEPVDENGYVVYCPCMGRFGNQADHFLGALAFSKGLNRTLVLPPWVEYRYGESKSVQVPFDTYFRVEALKAFHRVITMENFMGNFADSVWPFGQRISFCYMERHGVKERNCNAKEGNPFGPFWDTFSIDFDKSEFYGPLNYDIHREDMTRKWIEKYPSTEWPVLAFTGAPASFPVQMENVHLHKYLKWSDDIANKAESFVKAHMSGGAFIGIHLRNGADWVRACQHVGESPLLFSAAQCVGYQNQRGPLTSSMCLPTKLDIIKQLKRTLKQVKDVKYIFVASDANHMVEEVREALRRAGVAPTRLPHPDPHLDLAVLARSNFFIGNCVSSYSAFVKRERDARGLPSAFWSYPAKKSSRDEL